MDIKCTECGGEKLEAGRLSTAGEVGFIPAHARFLASNSTVKMHVYVCTACGHVMMQCDPEELAAKARTDAVV